MEMKEKIWLPIIYYVLQVTPRTVKQFILATEERIVSLNSETVLILVIVLTGKLYHTNENKTKNNYQLKIPSRWLSLK